MATVRTVTLPDGSTFTMSDWGDYPLFSRAELDANVAQDVLTFNYVQSQEIPGAALTGRATLMDTNMPTASQLPLRHQMVIFSVQIRFDEIDTKNSTNVFPVLTPAQEAAGTSAKEGLNKWNILTSNCYFVLLVESVKPYTEGPLTQYPHGGGLFYNKSEPALAIVAATQQGYSIQNGEPGTHAARRLAMPVHIGALEQFQGLLKFPRGSVLNTYLTGTDMEDDVDVGKMGVNIGLFGPRQRPIG